MDSICKQTIILGLGIVLLLTGCGLSQPEVEIVTLEPATLNLVTFEQSSNWGKAETETIERFQETYPQVEINRQSYNRAPQNYLTASTPPDLMAMGHNYFLHRAIEQDQLADLTDIWIESALIETYPPAFQTLSQVEGKQYYVPLGYAWAAVYYNKTVFDQFNLQPPQTWDEFLQICDTLANNGVAPIAVSGDDAFMGMMWFSYLNMRLNGPDFHREVLRGNIPFNDARLRDVFETWQGLFDQGCYVERPSVMDDFDALAALIRDDQNILTGEKAAMVLAAPYDVDSLPQKFQADLGFFRFPIIDSAVPIGEVVEAYGYMMPKNAANKPQSLALLSYLSTADAQTALAMYNGGAVTYAPTNADVDRNILSLEAQQGMDLVQEADGVVPRFMLSMPNAMWGEIFNSYGRFMRQSGTIDDFIDTLEEGRQETIDEGLFIASP